MPDIFNSIFGSETQSTISVGNFLLCILISLIAGGIYLLSCKIKTDYSRSFKSAVLLLPMIVCVVIMVVNGNIGIGVAVAGAFSLVRFRSAQGSAKEICLIFAAMCSGLIAGVGYLAYSLLFTIIAAGLIVAVNAIITVKEKEDCKRVLKITVPEDLDYPDLFTDIFTEYASDYTLTQVKTTNMGSLFRLSYKITLKKGANEKEFMDKIRVRNGNLEIFISREEENYAL